MKLLLCSLSFSAALFITGCSEVRTVAPPHDSYGTGYPDNHYKPSQPYYPGPNTNYYIEVPGCPQVPGHYSSGISSADSWRREGFESGRADRLSHLSPDYKRHSGRFDIRFEAEYARGYHDGYRGRRL